MKLIKHCHELEASTSGSGIAQGALLGLVADTRLEITHCFPFPSGTDETVDDEDFQLTMMRRLRQVNVDHQHVGWYQSSQFGNFLSSQVISISQTCLDLISSFSFWSPNSRIKLQLTSLCVWCSTRPKPARVFCLSRPTGSPPSFPTKLSCFPAG